VVAAIIPWGMGRAETQVHAGPEVTPSDQRPWGEAVFLVRADGSSGLGFLVDPQGLILTDVSLVEKAPYIAVRRDARRQFMAQVLVLDRKSGTAVLRVAPAAVADVTPLALLGEDEEPLREGDEVLVVGRSDGGFVLSATTGVVKKIGRRVIVHSALATKGDVGGPLLNSRGAVIGMNVASTRERMERRRAVPIRLALEALRESRERAAGLEPPPAASLTAVDAVESPGVPGEGSAALEPNLADYRTRVEDGRIEFLTPALIRALNNAPPDSSVAGAAPWEWQRHAALRGRVVAVQIVPDLRWTAGSGFRVTGRIVSYPVLAGIQVGLVLVVAFVAFFGGDGDLEPLILPAVLWKPVRAAYHFKGDFEAARLLRGAEEIAPIDGQRLCGTSKVWLARKPGQKPRWRKVRGCWGTYTFPAEAFQPGAPVEVRVFEEGKKDGPRIVAVPEELAARIWSDFQP
jgi:hypothetical protein